MEDNLEQRTTMIRYQIQNWLYFLGNMKETGWMTVELMTETWNKTTSQSRPCHKDPAFN